MHEYDGIICRTFPDVVQHIEGRGKGSAFRLTLRAECELDVPYSLEYIYEYQRNVCIVLEEAEIYLSRWGMPDELRDIISFGRHRDLSLIAVGRRVPELNIALRAQATSIITFQQTEPRDIQTLLSYGFTEEQLASLQEHEYSTIGEPLESFEQTE